MSEAVSALGNASFEGFATIRELGPVGMITLRAKHDLPALPKALKTVLTAELPERRRIISAGEVRVGWMSPDELLILLPYAEVADRVVALTEALGTAHALVADVSDARCLFAIEGEKAAQVLMKLCPVDMAALERGELRRTRAAQVPAAFWAEEGGLRLVAFRSVAAYVMGILTHSARPGSELFPA
ncbi:sarcosine oxidase subunit gamma [Cereibacter azotoformans]|uniref:Heterotetrameric sarcosine oxidase gamma subunit n=1 Tax=Cereibacter azotoformans TaxID=43057 RepID=A0A2T5KBD3_9RHOB|nr:sarcosine oxidase subunit gamma family protein [Cereibacter azotoformans]AXQ93789.1 sarcosine oxidase subunit gamma [Cereibacter sphaeroides]MBO4168409.1 sarcosine oxidase subunit gamma [Cereibacter azotoformans]PTR19724.1 heterotetrameric sarcosine oxidase gamma subunit [Cereibacter azotoformans]UIJ29304.1 sarcosine oxidase subunit gamma [Cereibacter azotoformans]